MESNLRVFIHSDLITKDTLEVLKDVVLHFSKDVTLVFPVESKIFSSIGDYLVYLGFSLEMFFAFAQSKSLESFVVRKNIECLTSYDNVKFFHQSSVHTNEKSAVLFRNTAIVERADLLLLGELLPKGIGLCLASIAIEKNKKILCCPTNYFSYGYSGSEFLINSGSATLVMSKDFEN